MNTIENLGYGLLSLVAAICFVGIAHVAVLLVTI
jgi:hypothetical protein